MVTKCFLDFKYGKQAISKDVTVKSCIVERFNKFTKKFKKIKLYYIEFLTLWDLEKFTSKYAVDFGMKVQPVQIDDCSFDMRLVITQQKKSRAIPTVALPAAA